MLRISNTSYEIKYVLKNDEPYFKAKEVAKALGYETPRSAVNALVSDDHKVRWSDLKGGANLSYLAGAKNLQPHAIFINESGLYELIFGSRLPAAKKFRDWVVKDVLPQIRKTGSYTLKSHTKEMFKIENEFDLHRKVVEYIRRFYPELIITAGLGELQDSSSKRIKSWQKGYQKGQPDLIIQNYHKYYKGFCLEFKTPKGLGRLSDAQKELLERYELNGYKTMVSNDYDLIIRAINNYCRCIRLPCPYCTRRYRTEETLKTHLRVIHRY